jgi:hypothetical protein
MNLIIGIFKRLAPFLTYSRVQDKGKEFLLNKCHDIMDVSPQIHYIFTFILIK